MEVGSPKHKKGESDARVPQSVSKEVFGFAEGEVQLIQAEILKFAKENPRCDE